jgi:hypothetical protein
MYGMRYGAIPVTRPVGGIADTVSDSETAPGGTGFVFAGERPRDLLAGIERALVRFERPSAWNELQRRAMKRDFGWERSAARYREIYLDLINYIADPAEPHAIAPPRTASRRAAEQRENGASQPMPEPPCMRSRRAASDGGAETLKFRTQCGHELAGLAPDMNKPAILLE